MLTGPALLFILNAVLCGAYISQREYCESNIVVKATILTAGHIATQLKDAAPEYTLPRGHRQYEIAINQVFRNTDSHNSASDKKLKDSLHYASSPNTNGCEHYEDAESYVFYFDAWDNIEIKANCKPWDDISDSVKIALNKKRYDCDCNLDDCLNRVDKSKGIPSSSCTADVNQLVCRKVGKKRCVWKGPKKSCVNAHSTV